MNLLSDTEAAYIAGIIDGEGTITLTKNKAGNFPSPTISVASSDLELLLWLKEKIGKGTIKKKKNYNPEKHRDSWTFFLKHNNALNLLVRIEQFLVINSKSYRSKLFTQNYHNLTPRNGRYTPEKMSEKELFINIFFK